MMSYISSCCSSAEAGSSPSSAPPSSTKPGQNSAPGTGSNGQVPASTTAAPTMAAPTPSFNQEPPEAAADPDKYEDPHSRNPRAHPDQQDQPTGTSKDKAPRAGAAPTGGAYRGWAPPTKEQFSETHSKGQKKRVTVEDQWDEDGNLTRVRTTKTFAPDWKTTTQTEFIPAAKAKEMGIERKTA